MYILDETENGTVVNALNLPAGVPTDVPEGLFPDDTRDIAYRELTKEFIFVTEDCVFANDPITGENRMLLSIDDISGTIITDLQIIIIYSHVTCNIERR